MSLLGSSSSQAIADTGIPQRRRRSASRRRDRGGPGDRDLRVRSCCRGHDECRDRTRADMRFCRTSAAITPAVFTEVLQAREAEFARVSARRLEETGPAITKRVDADYGSEVVPAGSARSTDKTRSSALHCGPRRGPGLRFLSSFFQWLGCAGQVMYSVFYLRNNVHISSFFHVSLWWELLDAADCRDADLLQQIMSGMPIMGDIASSHRWVQFLSMQLRSRA